MNASRTALVLAGFALATLASGLYRYLSAEGGDKGLWFGVVLGAVGLLGAGALASGRRRTGLAFGALAVLTVGGWFGYEALILKGLAVAETRQLVLLALSLLTGFALVLHSRGDAR